MALCMESGIKTFGGAEISRSSVDIHMASPVVPDGGWNNRSERLCVQTFVELTENANKN